VPLYPYRCQKGHAFDDLRSIDRRDRPEPCPTCGSPLIRDPITPFSSILAQRAIPGFDPGMKRPVVESAGPMSWLEGNRIEASGGGIRLRGQTVRGRNNLIQNVKGTALEATDSDVHLENLRIE
jgi:putative FmdB family regulatory protein